MSETICILVVDDNPGIADTLADILEVKGFRVHVADSGAEALEILTEADYRYPADGCENAGDEWVGALPGNQESLSESYHHLHDGVFSR